MRRFILENEIGQKYDLNNVGTGFMANPTGLGYSMSASYTKIGTVWTRNSFEDTQAGISADIVIAGTDPYNAIQDFYKFIRESKELVLHRITPAGEFLKDVDLVSMDIKELGEGGTLTVPVKFTARSLWYLKSNVKYQFATGSSGRVTRYSYRYSARFKDNVSGYVELTNDGSTDAPMLIVAEGPLVNPSFELSVNGVDMYSVEIDAEITAGERIEWCSRDGNLFCEKVSALGVRTNLVSSFDISNTNFFKAPVGVCRMTVEADNTITAPITLTMYKQYRAV